MKSIYDLEDIDVDQLLAKINTLSATATNANIADLQKNLVEIRAATITPVEKYYLTLLAIREKSFSVASNQSAIAGRLLALLGQSLLNLHEARFEVSEIGLELCIEESLKHYKHHLTFDADVYNSLSHHIFCHKWKVGGSLSDYSFWHEVAANLQYNLDNNNYNRILVDALIKFKFSSKSEILDSDDVNYSQFGNDGYIDTNSRVREETNLKLEIEIWKPENIIRLLLNYLRHYAKSVNNNVTLIEEKAIAIRNHVLYPLTKDFVNPAREKFGFSKYTHDELLNYYNMYEDKVFEICVECSTPASTTEFNFPQVKGDKKSAKIKFSSPEHSPSFVEKHPILINSLKGLGLGLGAFAIAVGGGALIYVTGGAGALAIGAVVKALGVAGSLATTAAVTTVPGGIIGAGVGIAQDPVETKKHVHVLLKKETPISEPATITNNAYLRKFFKNSKTAVNTSELAEKQQTKAAQADVISDNNRIIAMEVAKDANNVMSEPEKTVSLQR